MHYKSLDSELRFIRRSNSRNKSNLILVMVKGISDHVKGAWSQIVSDIIS